jgi:hypothetical protein
LIEKQWYVKSSTQDETYWEEIWNLSLKSSKEEIEISCLLSITPYPDWSCNAGKYIFHWIVGEIEFQLESWKKGGYMG